MDPRIIPIQVKGESITMPVEVQLSPGEVVTWVVNSDPTIPWLVSFADGRVFQGLTDLDKTPPRLLGRSPDFRTGEGIKIGDEKGRYSYRFAIYAGGKIHAVFDCPSIIIT